MAPKKKVPDAQVIDDKQQTLENIKRQCLAMEQLLLLASEEIRCISHEKRVLEKKIAEMIEHRETTESTTGEQMRMMRRSTSTLSYQLNQRIKSLEQSVATAENENASIRNELESMRSRKTDELERLNNEAAVLRKELQEKALSSAVLLRDVLLDRHRRVVPQAAQGAYFPMTAVAECTVVFPLRHNAASPPPDFEELEGITFERVNWKDAFDSFLEKQREELWAAKTAFDKIDISVYTAARDALFPQAVSGVQGVVAFRNRAGYKLSEAMEATGLWDHLRAAAQRAKGSFTFVDVCGGPGAFSQALFAMGKEHKLRLRGFGMTLRNVKGLDWYANLPSRSFFPSYGIDGTGDIFKLENVESLRSLVCRENVQLVVADGGFDVPSEVVNYQETISSRIIFGQWLSALKLLRPGGCLVLKIFDTFSPFTRAVLLLTTYLYECVQVVKPRHSRVVNSEKYLVAIGFVGVPKRWMEYFERCYQEGFVDNDNIPTVFPTSWCAGDETFSADLERMSSTIASNQVNGLRAILEKVLATPEVDKAGS